MKADLDQKIARLLTHQVADVIVRESLEKKLRSGKKLRIKLGADPSRPDLHIGHAVLLRKLREFQDLGHKVIFLIGDFTAKIGDPTGKSKTRPMLSDKEIKANAKTYLAQVGKVLDVKKAEVRYNSEWLGKMKAADFVSLCAQFTVARIIERDDFSKRLKSGTDVHMHELLYPMLQAQDSIDLKADVEIGATDQTFNMLAGRALMSKKGLVPQDVMTTELLVGTDGKEKMSKSLGNYIGLTDSADEMFGKTMSVPDAALQNWIELAADYSQEEMQFERGQALQKPMEVKMRLGFRIAKMYHGEDMARQAMQMFIDRFQKKQLPDSKSIEPMTRSVSGMNASTMTAEAFGISKSEARRLIEQGGVKLDGETLKDPNAIPEIPKEGGVLQKGKLHFKRVKK